MVWFDAIFFEGGIRGGGEDLGWKRGWGGGVGLVGVDNPRWVSRLRLFAPRSDGIVLKGFCSLAGFVVGMGGCGRCWGGGGGGVVEGKIWCGVRWR